MRKGQLLDEFTKIIFEQDPMGLYFEDNPDKENEYDAEALSILARFTECHLIGMAKEDAFNLALSIVQMAFNFWFHEGLSQERAKPLTEALFAAYEASYPEQKTQTEVGSEP